MGGVHGACAGPGSSLTVAIGVSSLSSVAEGRIGGWSWRLVVRGWRVVEPRSLMAEVGDKVWKRQPCWGS